MGLTHGGHGAVGPIASAAMRSLLLAAAVVAVIPAASASAKPSSCGKADAGFEDKITAAGGVQCAKARTVAKQWHKQVAGKEGSPKRIVHVGPFLCTGKNGPDPEHFKITCKAAGTKHVIAFVAGP
jgi:hypothetical protein